MENITEKMLSEELDGLIFKLVAMRKRAVLFDLGVGTLADIERRLVLATVAACEGNRLRASRSLGITNVSVGTRLRAYLEGLTPKPRRGPDLRLRKTPKGRRPAEGGL